LSSLRYKRVLLKLSGEALAGDDKRGLNQDVLGEICDKIKEIVNLGAEVAIVVGGGNFWRGKYGNQIEQTSSDYMGMLATCINGLALQDSLEYRGVSARLQTSIEMKPVAEPFMQKKAIQYLEQGKVVIFSAGTGHPFFSTDTAAALRAAEIGAEVILLGKTTDAIYSADPKTNPDAVRYNQISYIDILNKDLKIMDSTATSFCRDNNIPIIVFGIKEPENIVKAIKGEDIGTYVS